MPASIGSEMLFNCAIRDHCVASPNWSAAIRNKLPPATVIVLKVRCSHSIKLGLPCRDRRRRLKALLVVGLQ